MPTFSVATHLCFLRSRGDMKINHKKSAGSLESSDVLVLVEPFDEVSLHIESSVKMTFGHLIEETVYEVLDELSLTAGRITLHDKGAISETIRARVRTACLRGRG